MSPKSTGIPGATTPRFHPSEASTNVTNDGVNPAVEAARTLGRGFSELKEYAGYYLSAKADGFRRTMRNIMLYAALGIVGAVAACAIVITAVVLLLNGIGHGLGTLFGHRMWLGELVAGALVLGLLGAGIWIGVKKVTGSWHSQMVHKYEQRKQKQREQFGHDVAQRAAEE